MDKNKIVESVKEIIKVNINAIHGINHWERVERFGHYLADLNGADKKILSLFAYTHDLGRENDGEDVFHGERSAQIAKMFWEKGVIESTTEDLDRLMYACSHHHKLRAESDDLTVQTCWDSDRLDMWRAGIEPNPLYLYTKEAKNPLLIEKARYFSTGQGDLIF